MHGLPRNASLYKSLAWSIDAISANVNRLVSSPSPQTACSAEDVIAMRALQRPDAPVAIVSGTPVHFFGSSYGNDDLVTATASEV